MAQESVIDEARWLDYVARIVDPRGERADALAEALIAELWVEIDRKTLAGVI
jgi:hypothetical protein